MVASQHIAHPRPPTQGHQENSSRSIGTLAFAAICDRRHRDGCVHLTGTLHGRTCVQSELDQAIYLERYRSHLGVETTRLIKIVRGRRYQPEEVHSKGARAPRPMEQRARKQQRGDNNRTTRADDKRGKTGGEQENGTRRGDTNPEAPFSRLASTCVRSPVPATWERSVRRSVDRCH